MIMSQKNKTLLHSVAKFLSLIASAKTTQTIFTKSSKHHRKKKNFLTISLRALQMARVFCIFLHILSKYHSEKICTFIS